MTQKNKLIILYGFLLNLMDLLILLISVLAKKSTSILDLVCLLAIWGYKITLMKNTSPAFKTYLIIRYLPWNWDMLIWKIFVYKLVRFILSISTLKLYIFNINLPKIHQPLIFFWKCWYTACQNGDISTCKNCIAPIFS